MAFNKGIRKSRAETKARLMRAFYLLSIGIVCLILSAWPFGSDCAAQTAVTGQKYALLIGINKYEGGQFSPLQGAHNDVALIKAILMDRFKTPEANITVLLDENATHADIRKAFERLAATIQKGDMVYIHYSGHGSYTCDLNGDEDPAWGKDSTWVCYGARKQIGTPPDSGQSEDCAAVRAGARQDAGLASRAADPQHLNEFDILDDEINTWLSALRRRTDRVVFVSDSCHSGTVMRGALSMSGRGLPMDMRAHPLGTMDSGEAPLTGLHVTACRDDETAGETREGGKTYGLFTWHWAKSLNQAEPGDDWNAIYERARVYTHIFGQHPQIQGQRHREVFNNTFQKQAPTVNVTYVSTSGKKAKIDRGSLLGVTVGSVYRQSSDSGTAPPTRLTITRVAALKSFGDVSGGLKVGDRLALEKRRYDAEPLKVFIHAELPADRDLQAAVSHAVAQLPAFTLAAQAAQGDIGLDILRPRDDVDGANHANNPNGLLPPSDANRPPQCWAAALNKRAPPTDFKVSLRPKEEGIRRLCDNLSRLARMRALLTLAAPSQEKGPIGVSLALWRPAPAQIQGETITLGDKHWRRVSVVADHDPAIHQARKGDMLTFEIENRADEDYYLYLVNITSDGAVKPFYPKKHQSVEHGLIRAGAVHGMKKFRPLILTQPFEYVRVFAVKKPIDIYVLEQEGYQVRSQQGALTPLEKMLSAQAGFYRGGGQSIGAAEWGTVQRVFRVGQ